MTYNIDRVVNVFHSAERSWRRDEARPRQYDAVLIFVSGSIEYYFPAKTLTVRGGDLLFLPENVPYAGKKLTEVVEYYCVDFQSAKGFTLPDSGLPPMIRARDYGDFLSRFESLNDVFSKQRADVQLQSKSILYGILAAIIRNEYPTDETTSTDAVIDYISANLSDTNLCVASVSGKFFISESQLRRNIKKATGLPPNEYIRRLRINRAKNEIINTQRKICEISESCGFSTPYYFSNCFTEICGISPREFRKQNSMG